MAKIILSPYQAKVFRDVEQLLKIRGNPHGIKVKPKAYWLSKRMAVYIMHNITGTFASGTPLSQQDDVENVYDWIFGIITTIPVPVTATGNIKQPTPSWIEFYGPFLTEVEAFNYPSPVILPDAAGLFTPPSLHTLLWRGDWLNTFWDSDTGFRVPFGFYQTISTTGPLLTNFSTDWPQHNNVFEIGANGVRFNMAQPSLSSFEYDIQVGQGLSNETDANNVGSNSSAPSERDWGYIGPLAIGTELTPTNATSYAGILDTTTNQLFPGTDFRWITFANELGIQDRILQWGTDQIPTNYGYRIGIVVRYLSN